MNDTVASERLEGLRDTEIDFIPQDWDAVRLDNESLFSFANGLWKGKKPPFRRARVLRNTNFQNDGTLDLSDVAELEVQINQFEKRQLKRGDIILERSGGGPTQPVGRVVYFDLDSDDFSFSNFTTRIRVESPSTVEPKYLHYRLLHFYLLGRTERLQKRTTGIRNLNFADYKKILIPLPPLEEQRRIAQVLNTIQREIAAQDGLIAAAREVKRALMKHLLVDGLAPIATVALKEAVEVVSGGTPDTKCSEYWDGEIEWITAKDVSMAAGPFIAHTERHISKAGLENSPAKILPPLTTILIARGATMGAVRVIPRPMAMNQTCYGLVAKEGYDPLFLYYTMATLRDDMLRISYGTIFTTVTTRVLQNLPMRFPSFKRQKEIAETLITADRKIAVEENRKAALQALFKSMLHQLMTGQIRLTSPLPKQGESHEESKPLYQN